MPMRCAIYARYSSDLQRDSSIEDQIRRCQEYAERQGWTVVEEHVRFDEAVSAASLLGRPALQSLIEHTKKKPRPFDRILIDDTSRLSRNLEDALRVISTLTFQEVFVTAVSQGIDSQEKSSRQLLTLQGMIDEQYLDGLADKVHRGQEGRVRKGLHPGGRCYGYNNVPIEDPSRKEKYGRPAVSGVRLEINEEQAETVRRIFRLYADGTGLASIAKKFNAEGVLAPQPPRTKVIRAWCTSSIQAMLRNERYRGIFVWNRTRKVRNPETGRSVSRRRPESEWLRVDVPDWRIVDEKLWDAVHRRIDFVKNRIGVSRCGGHTRTQRSRTYLFSGLLVCGECQSRMVIISGGGKRGYVRYGCPSHRYRATCENALTIRRERLEDQLLGALEERLLNPEIMQYTLRRFREELDKRLAEIQRQGGRSGLQREQRDLKEQATRLSQAIATAGQSPTLLAHLGSIESKLAEIERRLATYRPLDTKVSEDKMRAFVERSVLHLRSILRDDHVGQAKTALAKHIRQLVLTPKTLSSGAVFEVSGSMDPLGGDDVMLVVARDGIEPPTPAFSGPRSTD